MIHAVERCWPGTIVRSRALGAASRSAAIANCVDQVEHSSTPVFFARHRSAEDGVQFQKN